MRELQGLLELPQTIKSRDYVVRLTEGVSDPAAMLGSYAITPDLQHAYAKALGLVRAALRDRQSSAAFVHGSFGTGKSHLMAITSLILGGDEAPWEVSELQGVLAEHGWVRERRLLRLHFHFVGAEHIEEKVFGTYVDEVGRLHPEAAVPPLFEDEALFDNAEALRQRLGDAAFFEGLNAGASSGGSDDGWGDMAEAAWDAGRFDAARVSPSRGARAELFDALVRTHFPALRSGRSGFVPFAEGLARMAGHAAGLGYDGIVLFLDELVLWLASKAANTAWLNNEVQKVANLVEAQQSQRAIPVLSFVARQRDIRDLIGDDLEGAEHAKLRDSLKWWEERFDKIELPTRNLPAIVERRVVRPRDDAAKAALEQAFQQAWVGARDAAGTLLGETADDEAFRRVYPFSPTLVDTLVALSMFLQRERTAIRLLTELLVEHLDDFELGQVVPIGDLYDVLAGGVEPVDGDMRRRFQQARSLYEHDLLPHIRARHGTETAPACQRLREDHPRRLGCSGCPQTQCRVDNRLLKTLILAALAPKTAAFKDLTASRLVRLNHGTIRTIIPGTEAHDAVQRLRGYAAEVGALRIGEQPDPRVEAMIGVVDLDPILKKAGGYDTRGARKRRLRELLYESMGLAGREADLRHVHDWRGSKRKGRVLFDNVRSMDLARLRAREDDAFLVVVDYPFDDPGFTPSDDEARVEQFLDDGGDSPTLVWLPSFFGEQVQRDLGRLLVLEGVLKDHHAHLDRLRDDDRRDAVDSLQAQASQRRVRVAKALGAAYGVLRDDDQVIDRNRSIDQHMRLLIPGARIRGLAAANLRDALDVGLSELLREVYPRHPDFQEKITTGRCKTALERFKDVAAAEGRRLAIDKTTRRALLPAEWLQLVECTDAVATVRTSRFLEIDRQLQQRGVGERPTVADVRAAVDPSGKMGLEAHVADLVVLCWAACGAREPQRGGEPVVGKAGEPGRLPADAVLVQPRLPDEQAWGRAIDRAREVFGVTQRARARRPDNVRELAAVLEARRKKLAEDGAARLEVCLRSRRGFVDEPGTWPRLTTARDVTVLMEALGQGDDVARLEAFAAWEPVSSVAAVRKQLSAARATVEVLEDEVVFGSVAAVRGGDDVRVPGLRRGVSEVLSRDEIVSPLAETVRRFAVEAQRILAPAGGHVDPRGTAGWARVAGGQVSQVEGTAFEAELERVRVAWAEAGPGARATLRWSIEAPEGGEEGPGS